MYKQIIFDFREMKESNSPSTTIFGLKLIIPAGLSSFEFKSSREDVEIKRKGYPSENAEDFLIKNYFIEILGFVISTKKKKPV